MPWPLVGVKRQAVWNRVLHLTLAIVKVASLDNGIGVLPAMGVNTWNSLRCEGVNAINIKGYADKLIETGLSKKGYVYVNIDDCWSVARNETSHRLLPDEAAFPNGIREVADYVHAKGLKLGIYGDRGTHTCVGRPGSLGYEEIDAQTYADWGIDYLKQDSCYATVDHDEALADYSKMRDALNRTGRHILFSLCGWNAWYGPQGHEIGNSWRIGSDSDDWVHIHVAVRTNENMAQYAQRGGFNDPDMLVSSNSLDAIHITERQQRTQFSLWAVMTSPLIIGSNLLHMSAHDLETFTNDDAIAINQDSLAVQGSVIMSTCGPYSVREQNPFKPWFFPVEKSHTAVWVLAGLAFAFLLAAALAYSCFKKAPGVAIETSLLRSADSQSEITDSQIELRAPGFTQQNPEQRTALSSIGGARRLLCCTWNRCSCCLGFVGLIVAGCAFSLHVCLDRIEPCQQIWHKPLSAHGGTDAALLLVNWGSSPTNMTCDESCLEDIGFRNGACAYDVWDIEKKKDLSPLEFVSELVPGDGGSFLFRLSQPSDNASSRC